MTSLTRTLSLTTIVAGLAFAAPTLAQTPPAPEAPAAAAPQAPAPQPPVAPAPPPAAAAERPATPIASLQNVDGMTISGRVTDIFGNKFVLEDASGRVLVETGPQRGNQIEVRDGEELQVIGEPRNGSFDAFTIVRADGSRVEIRPAGGPRGERDGPRGERAERQGEERQASIGGPRRSGDRGPRRVEAGSELSREEITRLIEAAGYTELDDFDRKGRHWEVDARNRFGEEVDIHVDFAGNIYKEQRD